MEQEKREQAIKKIVDRIGADSSCTSLSCLADFVLAAQQSYDAGHAAGQQQWVAIESADDLPKESGRYLWEMKEGYYTEANHDPQVRNAAFYVERFRAWMPIPEYQRPSAVEGDKNDER